MTLRHDRGPDLHFGQDSAEVITISAPISGVPANYDLMQVLQDLFDQTVLLENGTPFRRFTGDAVLKAVGLFATFSGNARIAYAGNRHVLAFSADAAIILGGKSWTNDAVLKNTLSGSFTSDAAIILSGKSWTNDAVLKKVFSGSFTGDAVLLQGGAFSGDAITKQTTSSSFSSSAILKKTTSASQTGDAVVLRVMTGSFTGDSVLVDAGTFVFTGNAVLKVTQSGSFTGDAVIGAPNWVSRVSQTVLEALTATPATTTVVGAGVTQDIVELLLITGSKVRVSQAQVEVLANTGSAARVSEELVEVLTSTPTTTTVTGAGVTQDVVEVLVNTDSKARVQMDIVEVLVNE